MNFLKCFAVFICFAVVNGFCELSDSADFYKQADLLSGAGKYSESIPLYLKSLESAESAQKHNDLGYAYYRIGDFANSECQYQKSIELDKSNAKVYNNIGTLYYAQHMWDKAEQNFKKALECDPDYAKAHFNMAAVNYRKHNFVKAYSLYREAKKKYPQAYKERKDSNRTEEDISFLDKNSELIPKDAFEEKSTSVAGAPEGASAETIFEDARLVSDKIKSLTGRLTKKTYSGPDNMESVSKFYYSFPDKCRIETLEPTTAVLIANSDSVWFYSPRTKSAQKADTLKKYVNDFLPIFPLRMVNAEFMLKRLADYDGCYILEARPKKITGMLSVVLFKIDIKRYNVLAMELYDPKGNLISQTKYEDIKAESDIYIPRKITTQVQGDGGYAKEELLLSRISVNPAIDDNLFRYEPNKETAVLEPVKLNNKERR